MTINPPTTDGDTHLAAQLAALQARLSRVRQYWFPYPDHPAGELCGVTLETLDGEHWALKHSSQFAGVSFWDGTTWLPVFFSSHATVYRWPLEDGERLGPQLAADLARQFGPLPARVELTKNLAVA